MVEAAKDVEIRPGWRLDDAQLEADAIAFWQRLGNLPADIAPEARAKQLIAGCYKDGKLIGVHTADLVHLDFVGARFALLRSSVDPEARRGHVSATLSYHCRDYLERWAVEHPDERLAGLAAIMESRELSEIARAPLWPGTGLLVAAHTQDGRQVRLSWFGHYRLDPPDAASPRPRVDPAPDLDMRAGWRLNDPQLESDAIGFWQRLGNLPAGVDARARAKELVGGCYKDGRLVGVATAEIVFLNVVRARFAMLRASVDPELRRSHAAATLTYHARNCLDRWSEANPHERLAGLGAVLEARELSALQREPLWPEAGLALIGFTPEGKQVRISWFDHYRLD